MALFSSHAKSSGQGHWFLEACNSFIFCKGEFMSPSYSTSLWLTINTSHFCLLHGSFILSCSSPAVSPPPLLSQQISAPHVGQWRSMLNRKRLKTWRNQLCSSQHKSLLLLLLDLEERIYMLVSAYLLHQGLLLPVQTLLFIL